MEQHLKFPSGRSVARVWEDIKKKKLDPQAACRSQGVDLPMSYALAYLKERERLRFDPKLKDDNALNDALPEPGLINWIIGDYEHSVMQTAAMTTVAGLVAFRPEMAIYSDFWSYPGKNLSLGRFGSVAKESKNQLLVKPLNECGEKLERHLVAWNKVFKLCKEVTPGFKLCKAPEARFLGTRGQGNGGSWVTSVCPRKKAVIDVRNLLDRKPNARVLIADNQTQSLLTLGSSAHFGVSDFPAGVAALRQLLASTNHVYEQRKVSLGADAMIMRRKHTFTNDCRDFLVDNANAIKGGIAAVLRESPSWGDVAEDTADMMGVCGDEKDRLLRAAYIYDKAELAQKTRIGLDVVAEQGGTVTAKLSL